MSDTSGTDDASNTTELREEVEQDLDQLAQEAKEQEADRMEKRDEIGLDEPS
jgi:hypothetical protein